MSTIHNIHGDMAAGTTALQPLDEVAIWEASTGLPKKLTGSLLAGVGAAAVATTTGAVALSLTQTLHANRTVVLLNTAPIAVTLPAATGSGARYRIFVGAAATATASTIKVANTIDVMRGIQVAMTTSNAGLVFISTATDDAISINGGTKGGFVGDIIEIHDVASGIFSVLMHNQSSGATATSFSAAV